MYKSILIASAFGGGLSVVLGAFGAHKLQNSLSESAFRAFETAVQYQFLHSIVLLALGVLLYNASAQELPTRQLHFSASLFCLGILLFSGSLYLLALTAVRSFGPINIGLITPLGGSILILGWIALIWAFTKIP